MSKDNGDVCPVRTFSHSPSQKVASRDALTNGNRPAPKTKHNLSFLRRENLLSPSEGNYIPPTPQQLQDLIQWAGLSGGGRYGAAKMAEAARVEEFQIRRYTNTNKPASEVPIIPGPVWRFLLIRVGIIEQPIFRRAEPSTTVTCSYAPKDEKQLSLRGKIWYKPRTVKVDIFDDSPHSLSRKDRKPIVTVEFPHDVSETSGNSIGDLLRHDAFTTLTNPYALAGFEKAIKGDRLKQEHLQFYASFLDKRIWDALWRLHDFNSISPDDFFNYDNLDPFGCPEDKMPDHRILLSLARWAGVSIPDLAHIAGEGVSRMQWLASGKGQSKYAEAKEKFEKGEITSKDLSGTRWANQISRQAWSLIISAFGLGPQINVLGRSTPNARKTRQFTLKEVQGVPTKWVKVATLFSFANPAMTEVTITGTVSTEKGKGEEWTVPFTVSVDLHGTILVDQAPIGKNSTPPESWSKLIELVPDVAKSYMEKAVWHQLGKMLQHHFSH